MWIMRDEYDEFGPTIVHRKCWPFGQDSYKAQEQRLAFQNALPTRLANKVRELASDRDTFIGSVPRDIAEITAR